MIYFVSKFHALCMAEKTFEIIPNVLYEVGKIDVPNFVVCGFKNEIPYAVNFEDCLEGRSSDFVKIVKYKANIYLFLYPHFPDETDCVNIMFKNTEYSVFAGKKLTIKIGDKLLCEHNVENLKFLRFEEFKSFGIFYFQGERNFVVIVKEEKVFCATYYDEINITQDELLLLCKANDLFSHGRVHCIKDEKYESYLVITKHKTEQVQNEFLAFAFMDCLVVENFKRCNEFFDESIKCEDCTKIKDFFPSFDEYFPLNNMVFVLMKNDTISGVVEFEISNSKIINIVNL